MPPPIWPAPTTPIVRTSTPRTLYRGPCHSERGRRPARNLLDRARYSFHAANPTRFLGRFASLGMTGRRAAGPLIGSADHDAVAGSPETGEKRDSHSEDGSGAPDQRSDERNQRNETQHREAGRHGDGAARGRDVSQDLLPQQQKERAHPEDLR